MVLLCAYVSSDWVSGGVLLVAVWLSRGMCWTTVCLGRNSEGSGGFRWVFGTNFHFWWGLCRVGICVGGGLGMIVLGGTGLDLVGCGWNGTFLGGPDSGLCGGKKKSLSLYICVRRTETLAV